LERKKKKPKSRMGTIHQKYEVKENTSRHNPKKKQGIPNMQALPIVDIL
jgi:hypothetical protein